MTKTELVTVLTRASGGSRASAARAMQAFLTGIADSLHAGRPVTISGFGTFVVSRRAARRGRDPRTGRAIALPPATVARFRASRALKSALR